MSAIRRKDLQRLIDSAPEDLWGVATKGRFYSEHAERDASEWVKRVHDAYGSAYNLALDLGWSDAWRQRVSHVVHDRREGVRDGLVWALYNDLHRLADGTRPELHMRGTSERALKARVAFLQRELFEDDTRRMARALSGIPYAELPWTPEVTRHTVRNLRWAAVSEALREMGHDADADAYKAFQATPDPPEFWAAAEAVLGPGDGADRLAERAAVLYREETVVSRSKLHKAIFGEDRSVTDDVLAALVHIGVEEGWLRTGDGEPYAAGFADEFVRRHRVADSKSDEYLAKRRRKAGRRSSE